MVTVVLLKYRALCTMLTIIWAPLFSHEGILCTGQWGACSLWHLILSFLEQLLISIWKCQGWSQGCQKVVALSQGCYKPALWISGLFHWNGMVEWNIGMTLSLCFFFPEAVVRVCNGSEWLWMALRVYQIYISCVSVSRTNWTELILCKEGKPGV